MSYCAAAPISRGRQRLTVQSFPSTFHRTPGSIRLSKARPSPSPSPAMFPRAGAVRGSPPELFLGPLGPTFQKSRQGNAQAQQNLPTCSVLRRISSKDGFSVVPQRGKIAALHMRQTTRLRALLKTMESRRRNNKCPAVLPPDFRRSKTLRSSALPLNIGLIWTKCRSSQSAATVRSSSCPTPGRPQKIKRSSAPNPASRSNGASANPATAITRQLRANLSRMACPLSTTGASRAE